MQLFNPYPHFNGQCEEAFNFYAKVLGGEIVAMIPHKGTPAEEHVPAEWRKKIIHALADSLLGRCGIVDLDTGRRGHPESQ